MKLTDNLYTPGRFSSTSTVSQDSGDEEMIPIRKVTFVDDLDDDRGRKISTVSNCSTVSSDYCEVMNNYDEASGEYESLNGNSNAEKNAETAKTMLSDTIPKVLCSPFIGTDRSTIVNNTVPHLVQSLLNTRL